MKCRFEHDGDCCNSDATQYMCKCKKPCNEIIPITNADRIRSMNDDELYEFLYKKTWLCESHTLCVTCPKHHIKKGCLSTEEWLKQPAEEGSV